MCQEYKEPEIKIFKLVDDFNQNIIYTSGCENFTPEEIDYSGLFD